MHEWFGDPDKADWLVHPLITITQNMALIVAAGSITSLPDADSAA